MLVTDGSGRCAEWVRESDVEFIQVREPDLSLPALMSYVRSLVAAGGPRILVNDRTDVAVACGAAGVHLRDAPAASHRMALLRVVRLVDDGTGRDGPGGFFHGAD